MKIAVLSGKGGTGKTLVSVNLSYVIGDVVYADCDIEEPNGAIYLKPDIERKLDVKVMKPEMVPENCTGCRKCVEFCRFNALVYIKGRAMLIPELCHGCGGCVLVCDSQAIKESEYKIGYVETGKSGNIVFLHGVMKVGSASGVPIIKKLQELIPEDKTVIIDCPPGSSCTVIETVHDCDYCILVTEPTKFGLANLEMVYNITRVFDIPCGVVVNKALENNTLVEDFCRVNGIELIGRIPYTKDIARISSDGELVAEKAPQYQKVFSRIYERVVGRGEKV